MNARAEFACFAALALAAHLGLWAGMAGTGSEASGAQGEALVSLQAASGEIAALVEAWSRPVEAAQQMDAPRMPQEPVQTPIARPAPPTPESVPDRQAAIAPMAPETPIAPPAPPRADTQSLRPPVMEAAPQSSIRPRERPKPQVQEPPREITAPQPSQRPPQSATPPGPAANQPKSTTQSTTQSQSTAPQTAAGQNGGTNAGRATQDRPATLSAAARQSLMARWGALIRAQVERRKSYPRGSRASGTTVLRIAVSSSGSLAGVSVARSSGARELDQAAIRAVRSARFPAAPKGLEPGQYQFNLPLAFAVR